MESCVKAYCSCEQKIKRRQQQGCDPLLHTLGALHQPQMGLKVVSSPVLAVPVSGTQPQGAAGLTKSIPPCKGSWQQCWWRASRSSRVVKQTKFERVCFGEAERKQQSQQLEK